MGTLVRTRVISSTQTKKDRGCDQGRKDAEEKCIVVKTEGLYFPLPGKCCSFIPVAASLWKLLVAWVLKWWELLFTGFGGWKLGMFFFSVILVLSSFVSFFGWRMGYCCLPCHLYVLFTHGLYRRSRYHSWFIFYCKCPFKSDFESKCCFVNYQVDVPTGYYTIKENTDIYSFSK